MTAPDAAATVSWWRRLVARHDMRLVPAAASVWLATLLGITCGWVWTVVCGVGLAIVATVRVVWGRRGAVRVAALGVLVCGLVTAGWTGYRLHHEAADPLVGLARRGDSVRLRVELTDLPKPIMSAGFAGRPGGVRSVLIPADAIAVAVHGRTEPVDGQVLLIAPVKGWGGLLRGQQVDASGQLSPPLPSDNATAAVLRVRGAPRNLSPPSFIQRTAESLRRGLRTASAGLPDDDRGLLPAIVIADRSGVRQPVLDDFRRSGMAYLMAVGGLHFMVVCGAVLWLLRRISIGPRTSAAIAGLVLVGFATVAGWQPNVLRAGLMVGVGLLALATGRVRSACSALAATVVVLVLWRPDFACDLGFALSVLATAAMVLLARPTAQALERRGVPAGIAELAAVALVAQLATAPLIAAAYGQLSLPAVVANILVEPAFVPAMLVGVLAMAIAPIWPWLAAVIAHIALPETAWLLAVAHHTAQLPAAAINWPTGWWGGLALAAVLVVVVVALSFRRLRILLAVAVVVLFLVVVPVQLIAPGWPPDRWAMIDCDVFPIRSTCCDRWCCYQGGEVSKEWQVHWIPAFESGAFVTVPVLDEWADLNLNLNVREAASNVDPGDPFMTDPLYRVDARLTTYFTRSAFAHLAQETKRNYTRDCCLFFNFLWQQGKNWCDATEDDVLDFQDWRRWSPRNPNRIGGAKWNRELAALNHLYVWAVRKGHMASSPVTTREVVGRHGRTITVPTAYAKDVRSSNVKWLTPRAYRLWRDVGLRGYTADDRRDPTWRGRNDDRNAAYADLLFSSGMRRTEGGSLLIVEVPTLEDSPRRYYDGRIAKAVTKSQRERTFYVSMDALRFIDTYCRTSRRAAIRRAQRHGRYEAMGGRWVVTGRSGFKQSILHWRDDNGTAVGRAIGTLDVVERQRLFIQGEAGLEPLWLWLAEDGTPFLPHSWEAVFTAASARCQRLLAGRVTEPPFMTPHMARHSFALHMLVALHHAMDRRFELTPEQRRDFRLLYNDCWAMVRDLLGHRSEETTRNIYLAPVSDLQVRSLLVDDDEPGTTELLSRLAQASERIVDLGEDLGESA